LYYTTHDFCTIPTTSSTSGSSSNNNNDSTQLFGYPKEQDRSTGKDIPFQSPYILLIDRGGCSFVQKVRNAQHTGAAAVLIADNVCLCHFVSSSSGGK
jgi:hypothetical protein